MFICNIEIQSSQFDELKEIISNFVEPDYENNFANGCQMCYEKHSFMNQNNFLEIILLIKHPEKINVSLISGGASQGSLLKFDWGTERSSIEKVQNEIELWCQSNEVEYEIIDSNYIK